MAGQDTITIASDIQHGNRGGGPLHNVATPDFAGFMSADDKTALDALVAAGSGGDMLKSVYDTNNNGIVDQAAAVPWSGVSSKPTTLAGYGITDAQPLDADLTAIAALTSAADKVPYATGAGAWALANLTAAGRALIDDADAAAMRTTLGLVIGTNVQAYDANTAKTNVTNVFTATQQIDRTGAATQAQFLLKGDAGQNKVVAFATGGLNRWVMGSNNAAESGADAGSTWFLNAYDDSGAYKSTPISVDRAGGWTYIVQLFLGTDLAVTEGGTGASTAAGARTNLGVAIGSNVQAWDADLDAIAALAGTSGFLKKTAANTWSLDTTTYAPLNSPGLTGTPTAPTAAGGTNTTQIATTAFVTSAVAAVGGGGGLLRAPQILTSGTSYTTPAGCSKIYVEAVGGGGAGGGCGSTATAAGGGGASGSYCAKLFSVSASTSYSYAIGAGGTAASNSAGGAGGDTTFTVGGTTITAKGGGGGANGSGTGVRAGGAGVVATNGDFNGTGDPGGAGNTSLGGSGGSSALGGGGAPNKTAAGAGTAGATGGGGSGAVSSGTNQAGGAGGAGFIRIWEFA